MRIEMKLVSAKEDHRLKATPVNLNQGIEVGKHECLLLGGDLVRSVGGDPKSYA